MLTIRTIFDINPPAATSVPVTLNMPHAAFIKKWSPNTTHRLKFQAVYIQLKYNAPMNVTPKAAKLETKSYP